MKGNLLKINPADTILVALKNLQASEIVEYEGKKYTLLENIPAKHKFYMRDEKAGSDVIMYGVQIAYFL